MTSTYVKDDNLQEYLEKFEANDMENDEENMDEDEEETGTYFVDELGNYYYQATPDSEPVPTVRPEGMIEEDENEEEQEEEQQAESVNGVEDQPKEIYEFTENEEIESHDENVTYESKPDIKVYSGLRMTKTIIQPKDMGTEDGGVYPCTHCNYVSNKRYLLARHMKSHSDDRPYKCSVCERGFKSQPALQNHINTHTGNKPHVCKFCPSKFTTSGELVRHIRYRHTLERPHKCTECDYASVELSKLKRHIRCHTGERPYQCPHCTYASPDTFKLKRHLRIHTGERPYECDICHAKFTQSNSLKSHKLIHSVADKPVFQCELCPTTCGRKTDLRIHIQKLHHSEEPIPCKKCNQKFSDRYSYKVHMKTHEGEKCYRCSLCSYASICQRHLDSHMLIHTDEKPFKCEKCDLSFRQKQLLKRHENVYHNKEYVQPEAREKSQKCPNCSKSFAHKGNLIRHMATHDPDNAVDDLGAIVKIIPNEDGGDGDHEVHIYYEEEEQEEEEEEDVENYGEPSGSNIKTEDLIEEDGEYDEQYVVLEVLDDGEGGEEIEDDKNIVINSNSSQLYLDSCEW